MRPEEDIASFCGKEAGEYNHVLKNKKPFIANLHGLHERPSSWVFTQSDLNRLLHDHAYIAFLNSVFSSMTVVFLGISADDVAAGGVLHKLSSHGFDIGRQFWITGRRDSATEAWASQAGLEVIRYEPELPAGLPQDHTTPIRKIISLLKSYVSRDRATTPVISSVSAVESLPSVRELKIIEEDELRVLLAGHAKFLIENNPEGTSSDSYKSFLKLYSPCIYQAWHITEDEPYNKFYGFTVSERISTGQFSNIWKIYDPNGEARVLKIIQYGNLSKSLQLDSFRRGVESLNYLTKAGVPGTTKFHAAFEIPTAVIIDYVEGDNLTNIIRSKSCDFWKDGIEILISIGNHLEFSHNLPQSVLHRDVRPSNVMVPYFYWSENAIEASQLSKNFVSLLNYDMFWHIHASGSTISGSLEESGFYAPEQMDNSEGEQARTTKVDSYGLGMTIFYMYTICIPPPGGSRSIEWLPMLKDKFRRDSRLFWVSAPERLKRLIIRSTSIDIRSRPVVAQIVVELDALQRAIRQELSEIPPNMWAEELFTRSFPGGYAVENETFSSNIIAGRTLNLRGDLQSNLVILDFRMTDSGDVSRGEISRLWKSKHRNAKEILAAGGWNVDESGGYSQGQLIMRASIKTSALETAVAKISECLGRGVKEITQD